MVDRYPEARDLISVSFHCENPELMNAWTRIIQEERGLNDMEAYHLARPPHSEGLSIVIATWLGTRFGKRRAFFVTTGVSIVGYALKWFCYTPDQPWLALVPAPLMAFGLGGLFTLMPSMIADVVDMDELKTHQRREGMYGSIFWWVVKLGMAVAIAGGGLLLNATGFDVALEGDQAERTLTLMRIFDAAIPCVASAIAIWAIATFSITEEKAHDIRKELERRRGTPDAPAAAPA